MMAVGAYADAGEPFANSSANSSGNGASDGDDVFVWTLADLQGASVGQPAVDVITDFGTGSAAGPGSQPGNGLGHDALDLRDLLPDAASESLENYLNVHIGGGDPLTEGKVVIDIDTGGQAAANRYEQRIVLDNVHSLDELGAGGADDQHAIIQALVDGGKLIV
jgi:hypothetical protein